MNINILVSTIPFPSIGYAANNHRLSAGSSSYFPDVVASPERAYIA